MIKWINSNLKKVFVVAIFVLIILSWSFYLTMDMITWESWHASKDKLVPQPGAAARSSPNH